MNIQAIIANVIDRCGGDLIREKIPTGAAALHVLNTLEILGLEIANTFKGTTSLKADVTVSAQSGVLPNSPKFLYRPQYVRFQEGVIGINPYGWTELFVLNDVEEITHAENVGKPAIWFSGQHPFAYKLSFAPTTSLTLEVWGQVFDSSITNLSEVPKLPEEFSQLVAVKASLMLLDDLLLMKDAAKYIAFANARTQKLLMELKPLEKIWTNFKTRDENRNLSMVIEPFDIFAQNNYEKVGREPITYGVDGGVVTP